MTEKKYEKPLSLDLGFGEAVERFARASPKETREMVKKTKAEPTPTAIGDLFEIIHYETPECITDFSFDPSRETLWATQAQVATLFGVDRTVVGKHLRNIFDEGELSEDSVCAKFAHTAADGKTYSVQHYNLDAILSVGYRVSSKKATEFRKFATETLRDYIVQGFALDETRLRDDPKALRDLAAKVRALRADEKNIYAAVRDAFAFGSTDYDSDSQASRSFYAKVTDKFLYAITGNTASQIILDRADHKRHNMGLQTMKGNAPQMADVVIGKNYLVPDELYALHILCEQFLLYIESKALRGKTLTMAEMSEKFDDLLRFQGHAVFTEYKDYLTQRAQTHAATELANYRNRLTAEKRLQISRNQ